MLESLSFGRSANMTVPLILRQSVVCASLPVLHDVQVDSPCQQVFYETKGTKTQFGDRVLKFDRCNPCFVPKTQAGIIWLQGSMPNHPSWCHIRVYSLLV